MREMTESTYNAIKNRMMTGANRFSYNMEVEGLSPYSDFDPNTNVVLRSDAYSLDYTILRSGKVLIVYRNSIGEVRASLLSDESEMALGNVPEGVLIDTTPYNINDIGVSVLELDSGKILVFVTDNGSTTNPYRLKVFETSDGIDYQYKSDVFSTMVTTTSWWGSRRMQNVSKPTQTPDGNLYVAGNNIFYDLGYAAISAAVFKSTDRGLTWARVFNYQSGALAWLGVFRPYTHMNYYKNFIWVTFHTNYGGVAPWMIFSNDNGTTWTISNSPDGGGAFWDARSVFSMTKDAFDNLYILYPDGNLYTASPDELTIDFIRNAANWQLVKSLISNPSASYANLSISKNGSLHLLYKPYLSSPVQDIYSGRNKASLLEVISISINKGKGGANTATLKVNNSKGFVNPRNPESSLYGILNLNRYIYIEQGYGEDLTPSFKGIVDGIHMSTFPQIAEIKLRDNLKRALDQTVTKDGSQVVFYPHQPIENIVSDLCGLCGLPIGLIEPTGVSIEKEFNWQTYADAIQFLSDIASFEFLVDESGLFYFRRDYQPNDMTIAWSFEEGVDIQDLTYEIDDTDIYKSVRIYGKSGDNVLVYNAPFLDAEEFNILPQKIMKIDATEASTTTELRKIAERAVATMRSRTRVIRFTAIAIPHLQVGDFIQLFESSTNTHEIYRLSAINLTMTNDSFTMSCTGYYYGDSIVPGDLPEDVAIQTPDPTLNLIPNMTSNTKPSGVASSSSTYLLYGVRYSPWRAFNNDDTDYFWDLSTKTGWIAYEFPEKTIVDKYIIKARQDIVWNKALPKDWKFEAFDGATWITLDTRTGQTNWGIYEERSFIFDNTTPYAKYRLSVSANNGYVRTQIEQLSMYYGGGL